MLSSDRLRQILDSTNHLHAHAHGKFTGRLFEALSGVFDGASFTFQFYGKDGTSMIETNVPWPESRKAELESLAEQLAPVDHPLYPPISKGQRGPLRLSDYASQRHMQRTDIYHQVLKHGDIDFQIALGVFSQDGFGGVILNRDTIDFTNDDLDAARILTGHIATAFESHNLLQRHSVHMKDATKVDYTALRRLGLSRRESEVMVWLIEGKRDAEIAIILDISVRTVNQHVASILAKLNAETRTSAVMTVLQKNAVVGVG